MFAELTESLRANPEVEQGRMLSSPGLRVQGRFFAFVGSDDQLIVKVPEEQVRTMVESGIAQPLSMRDRVMKEWVCLDLPQTPADEQSWTDAIANALVYVRSLPDKPPRKKRKPTS